MKTIKNNKLGFNKNTMVELNNDELLEINGGGTTTWLCVGIIIGLLLD